MNNELNYYKLPGQLTDLSVYAETIKKITDNPEYICQIVQGLIVHGAWVKQYGFEYNDENECYHLLNMSDLLRKILEFDSRSLTIARLPENRLIACCREFATLACAIMRTKGIPARSRCGFAVYLGWKGSLEDHWIVEYWNGDRWVMNDPQVDPFQLSQLMGWGYNKLSIQSELSVPNPHDLTDNDFIIAGKAWQMCRNGIISPDICGIADLKGLWFVRGQLLRDFAALNKIETVPHLCRTERGLDWSLWKLLNKKDDEITSKDLELLDNIAALTLNVKDNLSIINEYYLSNSALQVPQAYIE